MPKIEIVPDERTLATQAATYFVRLASQAVEEHGRFTVALSGGSTPRLMYSLLAKSPFTSQVDWRKAHIFWSDERCVPADHWESNYHVANEALLSRVPLPSEHVYRIPGELAPHIAAQVYEEELRRVFGEGTPRFDLVLLGMGADGHVASLFPDSELIENASSVVAAVRPNRIPPPLVDRVTMTPPVLNAARHVMFLVSGDDKASIVAEVLQGPYRPHTYPAQVVQPTDGELIWLLDEAAASWMTRYN